MERATTDTDTGAICEYLREPVFLLDADGRFAYANARFLEVTQLSRTAVVGADLGLLEQFLPDGFASLQEAVDDALAADETVDWRFDFTHLHPEGAPVPRTLPVEYRIVTSQVPGVARGVLVSVRDVTNRMERERDLEERTEQLLLLNRLLRHDIGNEIAVIEGWAEMLTEETEGEIRERADRIRNAAFHVSEMIREASSALRAIDDGDGLDCRPLSVGDQLRREIDFVRNDYPNATIELVDDERADRVCANELLRPVFTNVITNAIVHNDRDEPHVAIEIVREDDVVFVTIADDGGGIPDARKASILKQGTKGAGSDGPGVGLFVVSMLVEKFGGEISLADNEPTGTVFTISLPAAEAACHGAS